MTPAGDADRIVFFTGAGMSAESGVPTYRGHGGIWGQYRWEEFACQRAFEADPDKVLEFHEERRARVLLCEPHAGHRHLALLQAAHPVVAVVTQNTDGLHTRAGVRDVVELHGSLWRLRCPRHGAVADLAAGAFASRRCARCDATLRPDIVWFEDPVDPAVFARAQRLIRDCATFVAVGTSAVVWPAAGLIQLARETGARMIELNVDDTELSHLFDERWRGPAGVLLPERFPLRRGQAPAAGDGRAAAVPK
jgi:NAD-dependent deacetylase